MRNLDDNDNDNDNGDKAGLGGAAELNHGRARIENDSLN